MEIFHIWRNDAEVRLAFLFHLKNLPLTNKLATVLHQFFCHDLVPMMRDLDCCIKPKVSSTSQTFSVELWSLVCGGQTKSEMMSHDPWTTLSQSELDKSWYCICPLQSGKKKIYWWKNLIDGKLLISGFLTATQMFSLGSLTSLWIVRVELLLLHCQTLPSVLLLICFYLISSDV